MRKYIVLSAILFTATACGDTWGQRAVTGGGIGAGSGAVIGAATALIAASIGLVQTDIKKVLAYSTVSQLGYMFASLGTGTLLGFTAAIFHLLTHACFKALRCGGAVFSSGTLTIADSTLSGGKGKLGGVLYVRLGTTTLAGAGKNEWFHRQG